MSAERTTDGPTVPRLTDDETESLHELYRHLHAHPELSMQEHATARFIESRLDELGVEHFRCAETGVVGILRNGQGPTVAFRADTDGLPIAENTGLDYASTARGTLTDGTEVPVMHGCGHDTHVTAALGAARLLARQTDAWSGTVVFVFQPGEETAAGAAAMVDDGLWDRAPRPEIVLGQHVMPLPAGHIGYTPGPAMAMADSLRITLYGRQSHGSQPQDGIDPILLGAHVVTRLQGVVSRETEPLDSAVVTVGTFHAGMKENIIPAQAEISLNIRTHDAEVRRTVLDAVHRIVAGEAQTSGAPEPLIEEINSFPQCHNDPEHTARVAQALTAELGAEQVNEQRPKMGSEDVGHLATALGVPQVYWFFGGFEGEKSSFPVNHSPHFGPVIEPTLTTGTRAATAAILAYVGS